MDENAGMSTNERNFRQMIRKWVRLEYACGPEVLKHKTKM